MKQKNKTKQKFNNIITNTKQQKQSQTTEQVKQQ